MNHVDSIPAYGVLQNLTEQGLTPQDIYPHQSEEDDYKLLERQPTVKQVSPMPSWHLTAWVLLRVWPVGTASLTTL